MKPKYFYGLEWLRFLMALYVAVYHLSWLYGYSPLFHQFAILGFYATSTFMMLSGFMLAHVYLDSGSGAMKGNAKGFIAKRLCNLYPIHVITLVVALVLVVALQQISPAGVVVLHNHHPYAGWEGTSPGSLLRLVSWLSAAVNLVLQLLLLHAWDPRFLWLNLPTWSISALLFFYLVFPYIGPRLMRVRRWLPAAVLIWGVYLTTPILADCLGAYDNLTIGVLHRNPLIRLPEFAFGILLCRALKEAKVADWVERHCALLMAGGLSGLAIGAWLLHSNGKLWYYPLHNGLLLPLQGMLLLACCSFAEPQNQPIKKLGQRLGEASLCIFAIQMPAINLIFPLTAYVLGSVSFPAWLVVPHLILITAFGLLAQGYLVRPIRGWLEGRLPPAWRYRQIATRGEAIAPALATANASNAPGPR